MKNGIRLATFLVPILIVMGILLVWWPRFSAKSILHETINVDGASRDYRLVIPHRINRDRHKIEAGRKNPVVIALHGALDTTDEMATYTQLDQVAEEKGFLLVYLQGRQLNWPPYIPADNPDLLEPDIRFLESICDYLTEEHDADPDRIYLVGVSQGGAMTNALVAKSGGRLAAAVCNCGWLPSPLGDTPLVTSNKCSMLFISGTNDKQVTPAAVREAHDAFQSVGHPVEFHNLESAGHGWHPQQVNDLVWDFLSTKRLSKNVFDSKKPELSNHDPMSATPSN